MISQIYKIFPKRTTPIGDFAKKETKYYLYINKYGANGSASLDGIDGRKSE